jgi:hypothetical protein
MTCGKVIESLAALYKTGDEDWAAFVERMVNCYDGWDLAEALWQDVYQVNHQRELPIERARSQT